MLHRIHLSVCLSCPILAFDSGNSCKLQTWRKGSLTDYAVFITMSRSLGHAKLRRERSCYLMKTRYGKLKFTIFRYMTYLWVL